MVMSACSANSEEKRKANLPEEKSIKGNYEGGNTLFSFIIKNKRKNGL